MIIIIISWNAPKTIPKVDACSSDDGYILFNRDLIFEVVEQVVGRFNTRNWLLIVSVTRTTHDSRPIRSVNFSQLLKGMEFSIYLNDFKRTKPFLKSHPI